MRLKTDCDVITHSIVKQTWHITTKNGSGWKYTTLGGMPRSSLSGPRAQEANTRDSKQTFINKSKLKKTSPAIIYR